MAEHNVCEIYFSSNRPLKVPVHTIQSYFTIQVRRIFCKQHVLV